MPVYKSLEVRWFFPGSCPPRLATSFGAFATPASRTDTYLAQFDSGSQGIKLREGNLEIKRRLDRAGPRPLAAAVGYLERWTKWSFPLASATTGEFTSPVPDAWIEVGKRRTLRRFDSSRATLAEAGPGHVLSQGCGVELTWLDLHGQEWWTFGVEAFGSDSSEPAVIERILRLLSDQGELPDLPARASMGYPEWLARFAPGAGQKKAPRPDE